MEASSKGRIAQQGKHRQGTHHPEDALSKVRIGQGTHCPRDAFEDTSVWDAMTLCGGLRASCVGV
jgi:hypothetical protein